MERMRFTREHLTLGDDQIPVLVAREGHEPKTVFMSYESFLELAAALYTALETLKALGIDAEEVLGEVDGPRLRQVSPGRVG